MRYGGFRVRWGRKTECLLQESGSCFQPSCSPQASPPTRSRPLSFVPVPQSPLQLLFLRYVNLILQSNKNLKVQRHFYRCLICGLRLSTQSTMQISALARAGSHAVLSVMSAGSLGRKVRRLTAVCVWVERERAWSCHHVLDSSYVSGLASSCCKTAGSKIDPCFFQQTEGGVQTLRNGSVFVIRWDQGGKHEPLAGRPWGSGDGAPGLSRVQGASSCCCALERQVQWGVSSAELVGGSSPEAGCAG